MEVEAGLGAAAAAFVAAKNSDYKRLRYPTSADLPHAACAGGWAIEVYPGGSSRRQFLHATVGDGFAWAAWLAQRLMLQNALSTFLKRGRALTHMAGSTLVQILAPMPCMQHAACLNPQKRKW